MRFVAQLTIPAVNPEEVRMNRGIVTTPIALQPSNLAVSTLFESPSGVEFQSVFAEASDADGVNALMVLWLK